jgi:hypothetical protein
MKICFFATTQMHVNSVSSPKRMIATWQAMHKVIWSTTSYILWKFVSLQQHKCMSILFPLQKEWLLLDKPCTRLYDPLPVTFSIAPIIAEETKRKFLLLWQRCGGGVRFLRARARVDWAQTGHGWAGHGRIVSERHGYPLVQYIPLGAILTP